VPVNNQESPCAHCICLRVLVEVLYPPHSDLVVGVAGRRHGDIGSRVLAFLENELAHHHLPRQDKEGRAGFAGYRDGLDRSSRLAVLG
jgi:hypothetical protein